MKGGTRDSGYGRILKPALKTESAHKGKNTIGGKMAAKETELTKCPFCGEMEFHSYLVKERKFWRLRCEHMGCGGITIELRNGEKCLIEKRMGFYGMDELKEILDKHFLPGMSENKNTSFNIIEFLRKEGVEQIEE
jgi:hypothetical protein